MLLQFDRSRKKIRSPYLKQKTGHPVRKYGPLFILLLRIQNFYSLALARLIADGAARFASGLAARLAFAACGVAAVVDGGFSDNADMSHNSLRNSFVSL